MHMHLHDRDGHNQIIFEYFRTDLQGADCESFRYGNFGIMPDIHVNERAIPLLCDGCDPDGIKGFKRPDAHDRAFTHRHFSAGFPECINGGCDDPGMSGNAASRRRNPAGVGFEKHTFPFCD